MDILKMSIFQNLTTTFPRLFCEKPRFPFTPLPPVKIYYKAIVIDW